MLSLLLAFTAALPGAHGDSTATPARRALDAFVAAFNGDSASITRFSDTAYAAAFTAKRPPGFVATRDRWRRKNLGPITVVSVETSGDTLARAVVRNPLVRSWGHLDVRVEPNGEHRVVQLDLTRHEAAPAAYAPHGRVSARAAADSIDALARSLAREGLFSGAIVVAHRGETVLSRGYGKADEARGVPATPNTPFQLASVGKTFTAVAAARLVERGVLRWDDPIARWIPDYPDADAAKRVTVRHLLTQSSGLADYMPSPAFDATDPKSLVKLEDYFRFFAREPLAFAPGERWEYRNSNYLLLGAIVERAGGAAYRDAWQSIFAASGAPRIWREGRETPAVAYSSYGPGRRLDLAHRRAIAPATDRWGTPAGGGFASAHDLARFGAALLDGRLVRAATRDSLFAARSPSPGPDAWAAFGFDALERPNGVRVLEKNGYGDGALAQLDLYPDEGWVVVVLSNVDTWGGEAVAARARTLLTQR